MNSQILQKFQPIGETGRLRWSALLFYYFVVNFFHLGLWNTKFWDDWYQYKNLVDLETTERSCPVNSCGKIPFTFLWEQPLLEIGGWTLRVLVVVLFLLAGWIFWMILGRIQVLTEWQRSAATILFVLLPINGARVSFVTSRASLMFLLFLAGVLLLTYSRALPTIVGLLAVSISAFQPSIQVFLISVPLVLGTADLKVNSRLTRRTVLLGVAVVGLAVAHRFVVPGWLVGAGVVSAPTDYNVIRPAFLVRALLVCSFLSAPFVGKLAMQILRRQPFAILRVNLFEVGLLLLALGTFPYMTVGHFANLTDWVVVFLPDESDWTSRYQLLQGPGYALLLTSVIGCVETQWRRHVANVLVVACVVLGLSTFANYYVDGLKQRDVISQLRGLSGEISESDVLEFTDNAQDLNARGRGVRSYEWSGMAEMALGREVEVWASSNNQALEGCVGESIGKSVVVEKSSGRLRALLTRGQVIRVQLRVLVACR
jgi:hypothetical protein